MPQTLEIEKIDLTKQRAYTSNNGSFKLSSDFELIIDSDLIITPKTSIQKEFAIIKEAIKRRKLSLNDLLVSGKKQRKKIFTEYYGKLA